MKLKSISFAKYLQLPDEQRADYDFAIEFGKYEIKDYYSSIPLTRRSFEFVKDCIDIVASGDFAPLVEHLEKLDAYYGLLDGDALKVCATLKSIAQQIKDIVENEQTTLVSQVGGKSYAHLYAQLDFQRFGYYTQIMTLCGGDITKIDDVLQIPYYRALIFLQYKQAENDLEKLITQQANKNYL